MLTCAKGMQENCRQNDLVTLYTVGHFVSLFLELISAVYSSLTEHKLWGRAYGCVQEAASVFFTGSLMIMDLMQNS